MYGQRHPWAFGQPAQEVWRDIWEVVGAQRDVVLQQGEPTWKFLATLAHELRNPLAPIRQAALVAKVAPDAKRREWALDVIERQVGHMALLLDDLLSNAAKYTDPGGHIALVAERGQGRVMLHVRDDGIGRSPEHLQEIFQMFTQVEAGAARAQGGRGIGLALSRGFAQLHGGTLSARSEGPGRGAEFTVCLPVDATAAPARCWWPTTTPTAW